MTPLHRLLLLLLTSLLLQNCAIRPKGDFQADQIPQTPDYSQASSWAALPGKDDNADRVPTAGLTDRQATAAADVFFLHPTTYTRQSGNTRWNAPIDDAELNEKTDESSILYQASIFNGAGKVYAPRYRQAHLHAYFTDKEAAAEKAFDLAYQDVKAAFEYYLEHYNQGRPIVIAAHSQGTTHAKRLMREFFDGKSLTEQLVAAYLVGIPVASDYFAAIPPCVDAAENGCFVSWRSYRIGHKPDGFRPGNNIIATNPLIWTITDTYAPKSLNEGGVLREFEVVIPELADAQVHDGLLWLHKPRFPWSFLWFSSNYHVGDYNLYYLNVRNNAILRAEHFLKNQ